jgi:hypothetical protein
VIQVHSLSFGQYADIEPLNPAFVSGSRKLRVTVDTETVPRLSDQGLARRLVEAFPGLARHQCRAQPEQARPATGTRILLLDSDSSANQAHLLEHLMLEMLSALDHAPRLSGVTCAYGAPPERNDIFVECAEPESGGFAALLAVEAMNAALSAEPLGPLYPDVVNCTAILRSSPEGSWSAPWLAERAGITAERAATALQFLARAQLAEPDDYSMNFSGEPLYRFVGACEPGAN